jgi:hypothetical protein
MGLVVDAFRSPQRSELGDLDKEMWERDSEGKPRDPWQPTNYLVMRDLDTGETFTFTTSTNGGFGAIGELAKAYGKHIRQHPDDYPVVELDVGSYQHRDRSRGRIKFPIFKIVDWVNKNDPGPAAPATEPPKSPPPDTSAAAALKPPTTHKSVAQPRFLG